MEKLKTKYNRRRALNCTLIEKSKSHPKYFKYDVTIGEKDGTVYTQPAYGKDMQDAISRLIWKERTVKVERKAGAGTMFITWMVLMGVPAHFMEKTGSPIYLLYGFLGIGVIIGLIAWWNHYINKS